MKLVQTYKTLKVTTDIEQVVTQNFPTRVIWHYERTRDSYLNSLCDKFGSDKGELTPGPHPYPHKSHTYADVIERIFGHCRHGVSRVFECGLGTNNVRLASNMGATGQPGASLRVWKSYFPNAEIYGADIDREILFEEERIKTFYCDQTNPVSVSALWEEIKVDDFDLIIDDGLHSYSAGKTLFEGSYSKLSKTGLYIIEDVKQEYLLDLIVYFKSNKFDFDVLNLHRPGLDLHDNSLIIIRKNG